MIIAFITLNSILIVLIEGPYAHVDVGWIRVLGITLISFAFLFRKKTILKKKCS